MCETLEKSFRFVLREARPGDAHAQCDVPGVRMGEDHLDRTAGGVCPIAENDSAGVVAAVHRADGVPGTVERAFFRP
ncbi:hypothetical protein GCM10027360_48050 [Amycolatopsis echigonensis]